MVAKYKHSSKFRNTSFLTILFFLLAGLFLFAPSFARRAQAQGQGAVATPTCTVAVAGGPCNYQTPNPNNTPYNLSDETQAGGGIKANDNLSCDSLTKKSINGEDVTPFISSDGFISMLCSESNGRSAIEVVIQKASDYLIFLTVVVSMIMIILGIIQAGTSGPGGISAAKGRIVAAVSSIALLWVGRLYLSLSGITGGEFLGVNIKSGFDSNSIPLIAIAIKDYLLYTGGALSVIFIIIGGIRMMTSSGNPQGIAQAKKILTYAVVSLVAIVGVGLIFQLIRLVITGSTT